VKARIGIPLPIAPACYPHNSPWPKLTVAFVRAGAPHRVMQIRNACLVSIHSAHDLIARSCRVALCVSQEKTGGKKDDVPVIPVIYRHSIHSVCARQKAAAGAFKYRGEER